MKVRGEWQNFVKHNNLDFIFNPDDILAQVLATPGTDKERNFCTFPFISFLGELSCLDGL